MKIWSELEKQKMRHEAEQHMSDRCIIQDRVYSTNQLGEDTSTWVDRDKETICGFEAKHGMEQFGDQILTTWEAILRLPVNTALTQENKVKITVHRGDPTNTTYEIVSPITIGISALQAKLKRVED
mgnify:CR=1 FL=1